MKGRFKTPLWVIPVLAMVMALGAFAVFAGINQFAASPAEADIQEAGKGLSSNVDLEKLTEPLETPYEPATTVGTGVATINPDRPGDPTRLTIPFVATNGPLNPGTGQIIIRLEDDWNVPTTLDRNQITLSSSAVTGGTGGPNAAVAPQSVAVSLEGDENDEPEITLTVPDMDPDDGTGTDSIAIGATVTVVFSQAAGIRNPTEGGTYDFQVETTSDPGLFTTGSVVIPFLVQLSSTGDPRGEVVTLLGLGFKNGTTVTFFRDANGDNDSAGESVLCRAVASSDDTATCNYTMSNPPFAPGVGTDCTGAFPGGVYTLGSLDGCNYVNAFDGENSFTSQRNQADINRSRFELEPTIQVSPTTANTGDRVTVTLYDYTPGSSIPTDGALPGGVVLGGVGVLAANLSGNLGVATNGQANFTMTIPANVPLGVQRLDVEDLAGAGQDITMTLGGATLNISHQQVIANQDLTITGNGFTQGTNVCVVEGQLTLSNVPLQIDDSNDCPASVLTAAPNDPATGADPERGILLTGGGTFTLTVRVEQTDGSMPTALLTAGTHELKIIDTNGAEGTIDVTIPGREMEVNPLAARPRDNVTIIGRGFIADNVDGLTTSVNVEYDCGGGSSRTVTADVDVSGNFRETLRIPTNCTIPSTNTLRAEIFAGGSTTGVVDTVIHEIPDALVRIEPNRGNSGTQVTIIGEGFRTFETVSAIDFGGRGTIGGRTINTDGSGNFRAEGIVVPGLDPGIHAVRVTVGDEDDPNRVTSSTSFEVLESGFGPAPSTDVEQALAPVMDSLDRAFLFDNSTKEWQFFDTRSEFENINTLLEVPSGAPIWLRVTEDTDVDLGGQPFNLTCVNPGTPEEDCWNLIVFP